MVGAVVNGIIKKLYAVEDWYYVEEIDRWAFNGHEINCPKYINKRIPDEFRKKGSTNPIAYTFK